MLQSGEAVLKTKKAVLKTHVYEYLVNKEWLNIFRLIRHSNGFQNSLIHMFPIRQNTIHVSANIPDNTGALQFIKK